MGGNRVIDDDAFEKRFRAVENDLFDIRKMLSEIQATLVKADETITKVSAEVMPTIESLTKSPMLKMLMPKGSK